MNDTVQEILDYYRRQGAAADQTALVSLLREVQQEFGGIPRHALARIAEGLGVKESFLLAVIRRIPSLRLQDSHTLEMCAGPNCGKHAELARAAEKLCAKAGVSFKTVPCMRLCGKGPNIKYDGMLYHRADAALLEKLLVQGSEEK